MNCLPRALPWAMEYFGLSARIRSTRNLQKLYVVKALKGLLFCLAHFATFEHPTLQGGIFNGLIPRALTCAIVTLGFQPVFCLCFYLIHSSLLYALPLQRAQIHTDGDGLVCNAQLFLKHIQFVLHGFLADAIEA